jgi:ribosomal protein S18 acetylase RimI-like enzyme
MIIKRLSMKSNEEVLELLAMQLASFRVEAELIGFDGIPPLQDGIQSLREGKETFIGCYQNAKDKQELVGAISYTRSGSVVDICRMIVHPDHFRKGIAKRLLRHLLTEQRRKGITRFVVSTGTANTPAVSLYKSFGFQERRMITIAPNITMTTFELSADDCGP